jgi:predicted unusual protein kinase regulating ubiquinone biosynthesis (AarF/ABC1/UbiB family)
MKLGQTLSVFEAAVPDEVAAPYRQALVKLQEEAPPMPVRTVHAVLAQQLGGKWRERFRDFDDQPAAAASIGQVHRGTWRDGRDVAIKIQYPGAATALMADLNQLARFARLFAALFPGMDVKPLIAELKARVVEELDYGLEADAQRIFAAEYADDPAITVPGVVAGRDQVLVTEWLESPASLAQVIRDGSKAERDHYGELYMRFLFGGPSRTGMLHADPHPGNFRLLPNADGSPGKLGVLDYGAVARLSERSLPRSLGALIRIAGMDDYDQLVEELRAEGFIKDKVNVDAPRLRSYLAPFIEPMQAETFTFSREWMQEQFKRLNDPRGDAYPVMLRLNLPPAYLLIHRTWVGGVGVLSQLGATISFRSILEESLPGFAGPE